MNEPTQEEVKAGAQAWYESVKDERHPTWDDLHQSIKREYIWRTREKLRHGR